MVPQPPDIPMPKPEDKDYMKVWRRCLQSEIDNYKLRKERDTWRRAFYTVVALLGAIVNTLIVVYIR